jgi:hypothetical protein
MKSQATMIAVGALSTLVMIVPSFAQGGGHAKHHPRAGAVEAYPNYYDSTAGSYSHSSDSDYGAISGAIGGMGH